MATPIFGIFVLAGGAAPQAQERVRHAHRRDGTKGVRRGQLLPGARERFGQERPTRFHFEPFLFFLRLALLFVSLRYIFVVFFFWSLEGRNISVSACFLCVLHLCIKKNTRFYKSEASMIHSILALVLGAAHFAEALDFCMPNICSRLAVPKAGVSIQRVFRQSHRSFENASSLPCTINSLLPCYGAFAFARHRTGRTTVPEDIPVPAQQNRLIQHQKTHTRSHPSTAGGYGRA